MVDTEKEHLDSERRRKKNEGTKKWRKKNKKYVASYIRKYYKANKIAIQKKRRETNSKNPDFKKARNEYRKNNPDVIKKIKRKYYKKYKNTTIKLYKKQNRPKIRGYRLKMIYKMTTEQYDCKLKMQNNVCAICKRPPRNKALSVDHDHSCCSGYKSCGKCVRGLLCWTCNILLGYSKDNIQHLISAIEYLKEYQKNGSDGLPGDS